jgi:hypothetical protein
MNSARLVEYNTKHGMHVDGDTGRVTSPVNLNFLKMSQRFVKHYNAAGPYVARCA